MIIAQITDTHVTTAGPQARDLDLALAWIGSMRPRPDIVLLSGDTVHNGRPEQYERLRDSLARSGVTVFLVPGNHDERLALRAILPVAYYPGVTRADITYAIDTAPVRIIALDTTAPGHPGGIVDEVRIAWLDMALSAFPARPTLLFMHHPPFRTGVRFADAFGFAGLRRFEALVARHRQVRRVVAGHVHCERHATIGAAHVTTCISTTKQIVPELFERHLFHLRREPAGFATHTWQHDAFSTLTFVQQSDGRFNAR